MSRLIPGHIITPSKREAPPDTDTMSVQIPIILLSLAASIFLGSQIGAAHQGESMMKWQLTNADNQIQNIADAEAQMAALIKQREELVKQATQIQTEYTNLLNSVIDLAQTDPDAREVVAKWNIQRSEPVKPAAGSTESSSPASSSSGKDDAPPEGGVSGTAPSEP